MQLRRMMDFSAFWLCVNLSERKKSVKRGQWSLKQTNMLEHFERNMLEESKHQWQSCYLHFKMSYEKRNHFLILKSLAKYKHHQSSSDAYA